MCCWLLLAAVVRLWLWCEVAVIFCGQSNEFCVVGIRGGEVIGVEVEMGKLDLERERWSVLRWGVDGSRKWMVRRELF